MSVLFSHRSHETFRSLHIKKFYHGRLAFIKPRSHKATSKRLSFPNIQGISWLLHRPRKEGPSCNIDCKDPVGCRYKIQILILNADEWIYMAVIRYLKRVDGNKVLLCALFQMAIAFTRFNVQSWIWFYYGIKTRMLGHVTALFLMCVASQTLKYTYVIPTYIIFYNCYQI